MLSLVICPKVADKSKYNQRTSESKTEEFLELSKAIDIIRVESVMTLKINKIQKH